MAFFNRKKSAEGGSSPGGNTAKTDLPVPAGAKAGGQAREKKETAAAVSTPAFSSADVTAHVLRSPRVTEKGTMHAERSAYLFDVAPNATKHGIAQAIFALYKVKPRMIRVVTVPSKRKRNSRTGQSGIKRGGKKAYVYLKRGESITTT